VRQRHARRVDRYLAVFRRFRSAVRSVSIPPRHDSRRDLMRNASAAPPFVPSLRSSEIQPPAIPFARLVHTDAPRRIAQASHAVEPRRSAMLASLQNNQRVPKVHVQKSFRQADHFATREASLQRAGWVAHLQLEASLQWAWGALFLHRQPAGEIAAAIGIESERL
jgi:hypothetical protein